MNPILLSLMLGIGIYVLIVALIPKKILAGRNYTRSMVSRMKQEAQETSVSEDEESLDSWQEKMEDSNLLSRVFLTLPGSKAMYPKLEKAGISNELDKFLLLCILLMFIIAWALHGQGWVSIPIAVFAVVVIAWLYVNRIVRKRNARFLNDFPDALDMIVRSVKSGYPLNAAVRMVAENMEDPVSSEFKQVADETAYGSSLVDALSRLANRIDEPDTHFFVVVLSVQQEVGGNLAEVLSNLSGIIRKRKYLRMKVKAITSEGRATAWVLGLLPVFVFIAIHYMSPKHLEPLFTTDVGHMLSAFAVGIVLLGAVIVSKMCNIEV